MVKGEADDAFPCFRIPDSLAAAYILSFHQHISFFIPEGEPGRLSQFGNRLLRIEIFLIRFPGKTDNDVACLFINRHFPVQNIFGIQPALYHISGRFQFPFRRPVIPCRFEYCLHSAPDINSETHFPDSLYIVTASENGSINKDSYDDASYPYMIFLIFHVYSSCNII